MTDGLSASCFFDLEQYEHRAVFADGGPVWLALAGLKAYLAELSHQVLPDWLALNAPLDRPVVVHDGCFLDGSGLRIAYGSGKGAPPVYRDNRRLHGASVIMAGAVLTGDKFCFGREVLVEPGALINGPVVLGDGTEVRQGAYVRGNCLFGRGCVVGHVTEVKHSIFLDGAKAGHFAYLGDSILGNGVNLGAGTKLANLRFISGPVVVRTAGGTVSTGLRKFGAVLGDRVQTGCNSVTNPGTLLGKNSMLVPNATAPSGLHGSGSLIRPG